MVDKGVVELRGDTPRTQRVYLTGYGRKQYEARIQAVLAAEHEAVAIFTDEEQRQLTSAMKRYINALNETSRLSPSTRDARFPCLFCPLFSERFPPCQSICPNISPPAPSFGSRCPTHPP